MSEGKSEEGVGGLVIKTEVKEEAGGMLVDMEVKEEVGGMLVEPEVETGGLAKEEAEVSGEQRKEEGDKKEGGGDPYGYLERDEFSSERFKIEVKGLPKYYGFSELKKLFTNRLGLNPHKIKPPKSKSGSSCGFMFVNFRSEEERQKAVEVITGHKWKGRILTATLANAAADPLVRKRAIEEVDDGGPSGFVDENETIEDTIRRVTTPWSHLPYALQLEYKKNAIIKVVRQVGQQIKQANSTISSDFDAVKLLEDIKPSPVTEKYRNKCEFTIGFNSKTSEKIVGFRVASYKKGSVAIGPVEHLVHLPKTMIDGALAFQDYIRTSEWEPFDPETHTGCWKQLTVRTTEDGQLMLYVHISPKHMKPDDIEIVKESLKSHFSALEFPKVNSFHFKVLESHGQQTKNPPQLLFGDDCITETILGLKFRISPDAFFQINAKATEVLYSTVRSLLEVSPDTCVLDVCCGTGTIGICVAEKCNQVLGIEMVASAVTDAKKNALVNNIDPDKCDFFAGKAEDIIDTVIMKAKYENIVAIVDPPRGGLHQRVLQLLRKSKKIKTLIYVSCDAKAASKNFVDLSRPATNKGYKGNPFIPTRLIPVDLFPHCTQSELILVFQRQEDIPPNEPKAETEDATPQ